MIGDLLYARFLNLNDSSLDRTEECQTKMTSTRDDMIAALHVNLQALSSPDQFQNLPPGQGDIQYIYLSYILTS